MSKNVIVVKAEQLRTVRQTLEKREAAKAEIAKLDAKINELTEQLRKDKLTHQTAVQAAEVKLLEVTGLGEEAGTFTVTDAAGTGIMKVSFSATYEAKNANDAYAKLIEGTSESVGDIVLPCKREYSRSGYNAVEKTGSVKNLQAWFDTFITTKLGNAKIEAL